MKAFHISAAILYLLDTYLSQSSYTCHIWAFFLYPFYTVWIAVTRILHRT